jgi:rhodanese-related sulfurtransferase
MTIRGMAVPRITSEDLKRRLEVAAGGETTATSSASPVVVDVRLKYPYEHSTITLPGAIRMAPGAVDRSALPRDQDIVLYDSDPEELVAEAAAAELIRVGFRVLVLQGGIAAWAAAKFPTARKPAPQLAIPVSGLAKA